ncbi:MAG: hypothetical protein JKX70_04755 [Phycisphaerales bacterium]|nr:hypothetical protein [Phycisphaerales bacterium]
MESKPDQERTDDSIRLEPSSEMNEGGDDSSTITPDRQPLSHEGEDSGDSLFETYHPRKTEEILAHKQAILDSHAAEAAAIILDGVEAPVFDESVQADIEHEQLLDHAYNRAYRAIRVQHVSPLGKLFSPGAQFVYALLILTGLGGLIGLAATIESPVLVLTAGIASPILLPICVWKWVRWLDSTPYYYRLLTSLGEDARNLLGFRLFWKKSSTKI